MGEIMLVASRVGCAEPESSPIYRPRRPRENPLFQVLSDHFSNFVEDYPDHYQKSWGPLRRVVERTVSGFLRCGLPEHGFARVRCFSCREEYLLPFSCKTRGVCTSCAQKRTTAWARWVVEELARPVPHRHVVVTLPKILRPYFKFDRSLLPDFCRWVNQCLRDVMAPLADEPVRPGFVAVLQLAGNLLNLQPHLHLIVTSGAFSLDGARFYLLPAGFLQPLEALVQVRVLRELRERELLSEERYRMILGWRHSGGFSVFAGRPIAPGDDERLERLARYVRRSHVAASKVIYDEKGDRVIYRSPSGVHPGFKANFRILPAQDFVAELCGFIPPPRKHETLAYGEYANVVRGRRKLAEAPNEARIVEPSPKGVRSAWRHLIKHIYEIDPLTCPRCGDEMRIVSVIDEPAVIRRILSPLAMWPPPKRYPKPRKPRAGPSSRPVPTRRPPRRSAQHDYHDHSPATLWNDEDLSQAPPGWEDEG